MSETNNPNQNTQDVDQALALANTPRQEAAPSNNVIEMPQREELATNTATSSTEQATPSAEYRLTKRGKLAGALAAVAAVGAMLHMTSPDKEVEKPEPVGLSDISTPYKLGSESIDGNKIDTTSEVALQVTKNIEGEQGGLDLVAEEINERTEEFGYNNLDNTVWVPTNADANPDKPGMQLVPPEEKNQ